jgi:AbrB family looped-hinge helix DNA binding protein
MSTVMKISPQGQIRIPKKVMQTLNIEKGDYVEVEIDRCIRGGTIAACSTSTITLGQTVLISDKAWKILFIYSTIPG